MMSAYRELKDDAFHTLELDVHLERCASCREELARDMFIGEQLRAFPVIEPAPDMRERLMQALAKEHAQFAQKAVPGTVPTPEFLKPYLRAHSTHNSNVYSAFSSAETGPLPIIRAKRKGRPRSHTRQFAVLGLAAMFLMVLMMGGLTTLLIMAQNNAQRVASDISNSAPVAVHHVDIQQLSYTTRTPYQHIASAVANRDSVYYTAYGDGIYDAWMLLRLDRATGASVPLLTDSGQQPMIVLGSSAQGVVWLQFDTPQVSSNSWLPNSRQHPIVFPWSVRFLPAISQDETGSPVAPTIILKGTFDTTTVPGWITTPVQGIWFLPDSVLIASVDSHGVSNLYQYRFGTAKKETATLIATAAASHFLTSPTASSDGSVIYWADEWISDTGMFSSNIWMQNEVSAPSTLQPLRGHSAEQRPQITQQQVFRSDGMSFRPQVADDTLFWLSTAPATSEQGTPLANNSAIVSPPRVNMSASVTPRALPGFYAPPLDASVRGQVETIAVGDTSSAPVTVNTLGPASALQVGNDFALWQTDKGFEMYDVPTQNDVGIGNTLNNATFLAANGNTAVWVTSTGTSSASATPDPTGAFPLASLFVFNWPK